MQPGIDTQPEPAHRNEHTTDSRPAPAPAHQPDSNTPAQPSAGEHDFSTKQQTICATEQRGSAHRDDTVEPTRRDTEWEYVADNGDTHDEPPTWDDLNPDGGSDSFDEQNTDPSDSNLHRTETQIETISQICGVEPSILPNQQTELGGLVERLDTLLRQNGDVGSALVQALLSRAQPFCNNVPPQNKPDNAVATITAGSASNQQSGDSNTHTHSVPNNTHAYPVPVSAAHPRPDPTRGQPSQPLLGTRFGLLGCAVTPPNRFSTRGETICSPPLRSVTAADHRLATPDLPRPTVQHVATPHPAKFKALTPREQASDTQHPHQNGTSEQYTNRPGEDQNTDGDESSQTIVMPLWVRNELVKTLKTKAPKVQTLSIANGFKPDEWCRDVIAWLRGRGVLTFFLAAVTGRAYLMMGASADVGLSEGALRLDAWLNKVRHYLSHTGKTSILNGATPLRAEADKLTVRYRHITAEFHGGAEEMTQLDGMVFYDTREGCSTEVRTQVVDNSIEADQLGMATLAEMHNASFIGVREETVLNAIKTKFVQPKPRELTAAAHHGVLRAYLREYASSSGEPVDQSEETLAKHMFGTIAEAKAHIWQTYAGYEGVQAARNGVETACRMYGKEVSLAIVFSEIEHWRNNLQSQHSNGQLCNSISRTNDQATVLAAALSKFSGALQNLNVSKKQKKQKQDRDKKPGGGDSAREVNSYPVLWIGADGKCKTCGKPGSGDAAAWLAGKLHKVCAHCRNSCQHTEHNCPRKTGNWNGESPREWPARKKCPKCHQLGHEPWKCPKFLNKADPPVKHTNFTHKPADSTDSSNQQSTSNSSRSNGTDNQIARATRELSAAINASVTGVSNPSGTPQQGTAAYSEEAQHNAHWFCGVITMECMKQQHDEDDAREHADMASNEFTQSTLDMSTDESEHARSLSDSECKCGECHTDSVEPVLDLFSGNTRITMDTLAEHVKSYESGYQRIDLRDAYVSLTPRENYLREIPDSSWCEEHKSDIDSTTDGGSAPSIHSEDACYLCGCPVENGQGACYNVDGMTFWGDPHMSDRHRRTMRQCAARACIERGSVNAYTSWMLEPLKDAFPGLYEEEHTSAYKLAHAEFWRQVLLPEPEPWVLLAIRNGNQRLHSVLQAHVMWKVDRGHSGMGELTNLTDHIQPDNWRELDITGRLLPFVLHEPKRLWQDEIDTNEMRLQCQRQSVRALYIESEARATTRLSLLYTRKNEAVKLYKSSGGANSHMQVLYSCPDKL